ncbi:MAG: FkbM family methyltransferase [Dehalococcoidia bacterium]
MKGLFEAARRPYQRVPTPVRKIVARRLYRLGIALHRAGTVLSWRYSWADEAVAPAVEASPAGTSIWVEVGAWKGDSLAQAPEGATIYCFEPNVANAALVKERYPRANVIAAAVAATSGLAQFHETTDDSTWSLEPIDQEYVSRELLSMAFQVTGTRLVPVVRLDEFMQAAHLDHIDMLAIDAQGSDLDVLRSLGERLRSVKRIRVEAYEEGHSQYLGAENSKANILAFMTGHGFTQIGEMPIVGGAYADMPIVGGAYADMTFERVDA